MFLTAKPQTIEDFLKAINFIAPAGYTLEYFITPQDENNKENAYVAPKDIGFTSTPSESIVPGVTDTIVYTKKDLNDTHSFSPHAFDLNAVPNEMPKSVPTTTGTPIATAQATTIMSPVKLDRRVGVNDQDIQIQESFMGFPKFTLFHFTKD
jgi:hypothetical protein